MPTSLSWVLKAAKAERFKKLLCDLPTGPEPVCMKCTHAGRGKLSLVGVAIEIWGCLLHLSSMPLLLFLDEFIVMPHPPISPSRRKLWQSDTRLSAFGVPDHLVVTAYLEEAATDCHDGEELYKRCGRAVLAQGAHRTRRY